MITEEQLYDLETYNYSLPKELIAQYPCDKRDESKLLVYKKDKKEISHHKFYDIVDFLSENDVLVLNNTKVIKAKFRGQRIEDGGQKKEIEILLISSISPDNLTWKVFANPRKDLKPQSYVIARSETTKQSHPRDASIDCHASFHSARNDVNVEVIDNETICFQSHDDLKTILDKIGQMPLPPYIKRDNEGQEWTIKDNDRYQTVFAKKPGAVAAPTASLHFTEELLQKIRNKGVEILYLTLHVGPGTFLPIRTDDVREHKLMPERFSIEKEVWGKILEHKKNKKRIVACGTTVTRTLEYLGNCHSRENGNPDLTSGSWIPDQVGNDIAGENDLYISPGYKYKIVDALITNFHLPKSSLLLLVSALIGWDNLKNIYDEAIKEKYRFFSYGDAMFII